jgi:acylphosphatase
VGFRWSAQERARSLGLSGWVRNLPSGEVELEAEGPPEGVREFVAWSQRGPPAANVTSVSQDDLPPSGAQGEFQIRSSGRP